MSCIIELRPSFIIDNYVVHNPPTSVLKVQLKGQLKGKLKGKLKRKLTTEAYKEP